MKKIINKKKLGELEIQSNENGFVIWVNEEDNRYWLVDGSLLKEEGKISLGNTIDDKYFAEYNNIDGNIQLMERVDDGLHDSLLGFANKIRKFPVDFDFDDIQDACEGFMESLSEHGLKIVKG
jgi:hypothetical protein